MTTRLVDYTSPAFLVESVDLTFRLHPTSTRVISKLRMIPTRSAEDLLLDGENLKLISASINGVPLTEGLYDVHKEKLQLDWAEVPEEPFDFECEVEINPQSNTALEGLYMSNGMYCTQCEAEGFRKITFYPDRPDVMARFTVRVEGDAPVMLSNGNASNQGAGFAEWTDPWPKPAYLFALVAGDLVSFDDTFTTMSGREVPLKIYVREGDQDKCAYAMDALKRSMRWDETEYGREYDLDLFMIVAVDDFNMGAMENKGLNVFNSKYVLASPETATDQDYAFIEGIIAHEYFHNWTGNRITCRDWFQLCLKEGLTVFRDQQFSGDQRSHPVKRISSVQQLRARQFREDAGPLAHPVRPEEYIEINNFYTATVYEKGAEVIGMLRLLVGVEDYKKALDLYFDRHDGQACTIEHWVKVFEDATGRDLSQFALWYAQSGTPRVAVSEDWDGSTYSLTLSQSNPPTPGQTDKAPMVIPVATGLLAGDGREIVETTVLELTQSTQTFRFENLTTRPTPSLLRGFSAPVILERDTSNAERAFLLAHDTDPFNRWEAGRSYGRDLAARMAIDEGLTAESAYLDALSNVLDDTALDPAFKTLALSFPSLDDVMQEVRRKGVTADPTNCQSALKRLDTALADHLSNRLRVVYDDMAVTGAYTPDAAPTGQRALRGRILGLISRLEDTADTAQMQFRNADNMTETMQALGILVRENQAETALQDFYSKWQADRLVIDKWFSVQAAFAAPENACAIVESLSQHSDFDWKNPNRFRSLIGVFSVGNTAGFHHADGAGYKLLADWLIRLDPLNPQTTARLAGAFETWQLFDKDRQSLMKAQLQRIAKSKDLSKDTSEIVGRILDAART